MTARTSKSKIIRFHYALLRKTGCPITKTYEPTGGDVNNGSGVKPSPPQDLHQRKPNEYLVNRRKRTPVH